MSTQHLKRGPDPRLDSSSVEFRPDIPHTPHKAYCVGLDASRHGDDLAVVVHDALLRWPMDEGLGELAELIACASLGYWTEGGVR